MVTFLKAQTSSLVASATDFLITIITVKFFGWWYLTGTISGTVSGGALNFYLNRNWVFDAKLKSYRLQVFKISFGLDRQSDNGYNVNISAHSFFLSKLPAF